MKQVGVTAEGPVIAFTRGRSTTWWGMVALIVSETLLFLLLFAVYFYYRGQAGPWPPADLPLPDVAGSAVRAAVLLLSSIPVILAERWLERDGDVWKAVGGWLVALAMAGWFLWGHVEEQFLLFEELAPTEQVYGSVVMTILNFHALHLTVGIALGGIVVVHLLTGRITRSRPPIMEVGALYWHYVDVVWVVVYGLLFLGPHVLGR